MRCAMTRAALRRSMTASGHAGSGTSTVQSPKLLGTSRSRASHPRRAGLAASQLRPRVSPCLPRSTEATINTTTPPIRAARPNRNTGAAM